MQEGVGNLRPDERPECELVAFCREVSTRSGEVAAYKLDMKVTNQTICQLALRALFNPELRYFVTTKNRWDKYHQELKYLLEQPELTDEMIEQMGGFVEIKGGMR